MAHDVRRLDACYIRDRYAKMILIVFRTIRTMLTGFGSR